MDNPPTLLPATPFRVASVSLLQPRQPMARTLRGPSHAEPLPPEAAHAALLWQHAVHDVRGKLGVVTNLTTLLQQPSSELRRVALLSMLERNVASLGLLLDGVADLARLEVTPVAPAFDRVNVAAVLEGVCDSLMALSDGRGLRIEFRGPRVLVTETDALVLERIAQNLMLNAVRYTRARCVVLTCGANDRAALGRWFFDIRDASPADAAAPAGQVRQALPGTFGVQPLPAGEGIGLAIVARLTESLGGDVESAATPYGRWTRVSLPRRARVAQVTWPRVVSACSHGPVQAPGG